MSYWDNVTPDSVANAPDGFSEFKVGDNEAVIDLVEEGKSKSGNDMLIIHFKNDTGAKIRFYIVNDEWKLPKLKNLQTSFSIPLGSTHINSWIGKSGIVVCKQGKPYGPEGKVRSEVSFLKSRSNNSIPAQGQTRPPIEPGYMTPKQPQQPPANTAPADHFDDDIPF